MVLLMLISIVINYIAGLLIAGTESKKNKKLILILSVIIDLGILGFFKYAGFITENLTSVRHTPVVCREVEGEIPELEIKFQTISANLASERLDLILGAITGQKREQAKSLLADQKVFVNGRLAENSGKSLKAGDEITVRGFGKFIYDGISSESRKGRLNITIRKYV